jgi:hypothetical protein
VVLDESVLHRLIGSPQVMHDALAQVAVLSERPCLMIQVLPASNGANAGLGGAINLASRDGVPEVLLTEAVEDQTTENRRLVQKASDTFDLVRADALPRVASRAFMLEAADQRKTGCSEWSRCFRGGRCPARARGRPAAMSLPNLC